MGMPALQRGQGTSGALQIIRVFASLRECDPIF